MKIGILRHSSDGELLIAWARVALIAVSVIALTLDPSGSAAERPLTMGLLALYGVWAVVALIGTSTRYALVPFLRRRSTTQYADFIFTAVLNAFTSGPNSPLFLFFVFLLFCTAIRFDWRMTLRTAAAAAIVYAVMGAWFGFVAHDADFELNRFVVRVAYLAATGGLLVYLGAYRERLQSDLRSLAEWPRDPGTKLNAIATDLLDRSATQLRVDDVVLIWAEPGLARARMAIRSAGGISHTYVPADLKDCVADDLAEATFYAGAQTVVLRPDSSLPEQWNGQPLTAAFAERFDADGVLSAPVEGASCSGRIFFFGEEFTVDDLSLAGVVASLVAARFDHHAVMRGIEEKAHEEERVRVACDLHDGVLQTLAAAGMQLHSLERVIRSRPEEAEELLAMVKREVFDAQRELRALVDRDLRRSEPPTLDASIQSLLERYRGSGVEFDVSIEPLPPTLDDEIHASVERLIREAITNSAKHAVPSRISVAVTFSGETMRITVSDDGGGLPFQGHYDLDQLMEMSEAPKTLTRRVAALGGRMTVDSGAKGTRLDILLPVGESW